MTTRTCEYGPCSVSLDDRHGLARYCCQKHKNAAYRETHRERMRELARKYHRQRRAAMALERRQKMHVTVHFDPGGTPTRTEERRRMREYAAKQRGHFELWEGVA